MIEVFKILQGCEDVPHTKFFQLNTSCLMDHSEKLSKLGHWHTTLKGNWFSFRVESSNCPISSHI